MTLIPSSIPLLFTALLGSIWWMSLAVSRDTAESYTGPCAFSRIVPRMVSLGTPSPLLSLLNWSEWEKIKRKENITKLDRIIQSPSISEQNQRGKAGWTKRKSKIKVNLYKHTEGRSFLIVDEEFSRLMFTSRWIKLCLEGIFWQTTQTSQPWILFPITAVDHIILLDYSTIFA